MEVSDLIEVCISGFGPSNEIYLEQVAKPSALAFTAPAPAPTGVSDTVKPWMGWKDIPIGHKQAITAILALKNHTSAFKQELTKIRDEWKMPMHGASRSTIL